MILKLAMDARFVELIQQDQINWDTTNNLFI